MRTDFGNAGRSREAVAVKKEHSTAPLIRVSSSLYALLILNIEWQLDFSPRLRGTL